MTNRETAPFLSWANGAYGLLMLALPRAFRAEWGDGMIEVFRDTYRSEIRAGGVWGAMRFFRRAAIQVLVTAARERGDMHRRHGLRRGGRDYRRTRPVVVASALQDLRHAIRIFAKAPGFSAAAIGIIGLGIGATTTIYSIVDKVLLRDLPYADTSELVYFEDPSHTVPDFLDWRDRTSAFATLAGARMMDYDLTGDGPPQSLRTALVTPDFFTTFGAQPLLGRLFVPDDYTTPASAVVVSYALWRQRWGEDADLLGRSITINGQPVVVVGVLSPEFPFPELLVGRRADVWIPFDLADTDNHNRGRFILRAAARLRPDVSVLTAQSQLDVLGEALATEYPERYRRPDGAARPLRISPLFDATVDSVADTLYMLLGAVGLMLLIACANVANLFLARGTGRAREIALRTALGAGKGRIITQLLTESVFLSLVGGVVGVGLAKLGLAAFTLLSPGGIPRMADVTIDHRVLGFAVLVAVATGVLFGIVPGVQAARADVTEVLKDGAGGATAGRAGRRFRDALVVAEMAMALVLMAGAGVLFNSLLRLQRVDPGFETEQLITIPLALSRQSPEQRLRFTQDLVDRLRTLPGAQAVGAGVTLPFVFHSGGRCCWFMDFALGPNADESQSAVVHPITTGYFRALSATVTQGRAFETGEKASQDPTPVVLNATLAQRLFGEESSIGNTVYMEGDALSVIGVVDDVRHWGLNEEIEPEVYLPYEGTGNYFSRLHVALRTTTPFVSQADLIREAVWSIDPNLPVEGIVTMLDRVETSIASSRFYSVLLAVFAGLAIALAAAGIYTSMLYSVGQRYRELGVRMALGARAGDVVRLIVKKGIALTALGITIGLTGAFLLSRTLERLLFGVSAADVPTYGAVSVLLAMVAVSACYLPARRAGKADPIATLRAE